MEDGWKSDREDHAGLLHVCFEVAVLDGGLLHGSGYDDGGEAGGCLGEGGSERDQ